MRTVKMSMRKTDARKILESITARKETDLSLEAITSAFAIFAKKVGRNNDGEVTVKIGKDRYTIPCKPSALDNFNAASKGNIANIIGNIATRLLNEQKTTNENTIQAWGTPSFLK